MTIQGKFSGNFVKTSLTDVIIIITLDVFALVTSNEIRKLRTEQPENLATLCYKATERLVKAVDNSCRTAAEHIAVLNCVRLLTRIIPYIFEDVEWREFFWSSLPGNEREESSSTSLAQSLVNAICVRKIFNLQFFETNSFFLIHFRICCFVQTLLFRL